MVRKLLVVGLVLRYDCLENLKVWHEVNILTDDQGGILIAVPLAGSIEWFVIVV